MNEENPFERIQRFFKEFQGDINIIDEKIDIHLQVEYFDMSKDLKDKPELTDWLEKSEMLFSSETPLDFKKTLLVTLASIDDVKAYRIIEKYHLNHDSELKHWAMLALQESRMMMQSKLLEHSQVLISTGLGGKDNKLRYFFALFTKNGESFTEFQKKIIRSEFGYFLQSNSSEIEEIHFEEDIATILVLVPLHIPIQDLFKDVVNECNQYGDFIRENCIITNVKVMNLKEIHAFLDQTKGKTN
jgi:hypothetical protein